MAALSFKKTVNIISPAHIVILCSRLDLPGGIEGAIINTANLLSANGYRLTLLVLDDSEKPFFSLSASVKIITAPLSFGIEDKGNAISRKLHFVSHAKKLRALLKSLSPNAVIATEYNYAVALVLAYRRSGIPLYSWEHHHFNHLEKGRFWRFLQKRLYPKLSAVICLNEAEAEHYAALKCSTVVIPNFCKQNSRSALDERKILTVGWLSKTKGVDFIPAVAEKVFTQAPDWQWVLIGTGDEEARLKTELAKRNLQHRVKILPSLSNDLSPFYKSASLYVMTSRFECFPMVLLEAMSHGIPCIAFDCPTGPRFIIANNSDGLLIEQNEVHAMAEAIIDLIKDGQKRKMFGNTAYKNAERFAPDKIYALWEGLLRNGDPSS